jgi:hypothetical protein
LLHIHGQSLEQESLQATRLLIKFDRRQPGNGPLLALSRQHKGGRYWSDARQVVMAGHSRPKDGVASARHSRPKDGVASARLWSRPSTSLPNQTEKDVDARDKPGHDEDHEATSPNTASTTLRCSAVSAACGGTGPPTS